MAHSVLGAEAKGLTSVKDYVHFMKAARFLAMAGVLSEVPHGVYFVKTPDGSVVPYVAKMTSELSLPFHGDLTMSGAAHKIKVVKHFDIDGFIAAADLFHASLGAYPSLMTRRKRRCKLQM